MEILRKATLILIGLAMVIAGTLPSPAMYEIMTEYAQSSPVLVPMIITLPSLTLMIGLVISSVLANKYSKKKLILVGLIILTIGGVMPAFIKSLEIILFFRAFVGIGTGMIMPLQTSLFAEYEEKERAFLIGNNISVNCVIGVALFALAGYLTTINWRYLFFIYGIMGIIIIMAYLFIPKESAVRQEIGEKKNSESKMAKNIYYYCGLIAVCTVTTFLMSTLLASYVQENQLGGSSQVGILVATSTAASAIAGMMMPKIERRFKNNVIPMFLGVMALGFFFYTLVSSVFFIGIGQLLLGFSQGLLNAVITLKITQEVPLEKVSAASSIYIAVLFIAQFLSPYFYMMYQGIFSTTNNVTIFFCYSMTILILAIVATLKVLKEKRNSNLVNVSEAVKGSSK